MPRLGVPIDDPALRGGRDDLRSLLGGKGAGLVELSGLGIPVPPAFVLTTAAYHRWRETGDLGFLAAVLRDGLAGLEQRLDRTLGGARRPLVVSVRSGAAQSMPGMMDTVLNLGLNEQTAAALAREWGEGVAQAALARLHRSYEAIVGRLLPSDPLEQIEGAVAAVFASWDSERARTYRARGGIPDSLGTAARIDAEFGFELERPDGAIELAASRLVDKFRILLVGGFGVVRAIRPNLLEDLAGLLQFPHLRRARLATDLLRFEDRIHGAGMAHERPGSHATHFLFRVFRQLPFRHFSFAPLGLCTAPFPFRRSRLRAPSAIRAGHL